MDAADIAVIYLNPHTAALKKLDLMDVDTLQAGFERGDLLLFIDSKLLKNYLLAQDYSDSNLLLMSSGNYDNLDLESIKDKFNQL
jgi:UDP-N-acetylmuramate: L-alanyl-gamma-D-glutamyl-meso-diaminopimelate ligase